MPRRLPSGRWQGVVRVGGRRHSPGHSFALRRDAAAWEEEQRVTLRRGDWRDPAAAKTRFEAWLDLWTASRNIEPETAVADARMIARHVLSKWQGLPLGGISRLQVQSWVTRMSRDGLGHATVVRAYALFAGAMAAAVDEDLIGRSPCRRITLPERPALPLHWWEPGEVTEILARLRDPHRTIAALMCWCGMRWEEAAAVPPDRVNWLRREITVSQVVTSARRIKGYPKNGDAGLRTVRMAGPVAQLLRPVWQAAVDTGDDLLWRAPDGRPLSNRTWGEVWRYRVRVYSVRHVPDADEPGRPWAVGRPNREPEAWHRTQVQAQRDAAVRRAGEVAARYYSPHTLRHTGASWLVQAGVPLADVGRWLGHGPGSPATARYAHLCPDRSNVTITEALAGLADSVVDVDRISGTD